MNHLLRNAFAAAALSFIGAGGFAQDAMTATCKDGTGWSGAIRSGACHGHGGVQAFGPVATAPVVAAPNAATSSAPLKSPVAQPRTIAPATAASVPPGGGAGQVWVNTSSHVYHCPGDRYYGHTKRGGYMTEAAAKAAGDRPDHGKGCGL